MVLFSLQVSNLKKIVQGIDEYYQECLNQQLTDFTTPDVGEIGNYCFFYVFCYFCIFYLIVILVP
jgi:hypothetical protein